MTLERISRKFIQKHPQDAVRVIEQLGDEEKSVLIASLDPKSAAATLRSMTTGDAVSTLAGMPPVRIIMILKDESPNFVAACLRRLPASLRKAIMSEAEQNGELKSVRTLLSYPPGVAGAVMDPQIPAVQEHMTVKEAIIYVKRYPEKLRNILYVVDENNFLTGFIEARDLLVANDTVTLKTSQKPVQYRLNARAHLGTAVENPGWEHLDMLPVIDYHGLYLGGLTRESFLKAVSDMESDGTYGDQPKEILIGLAETFLNTCSELLFPDRK